MLLFVLISVAWLTIAVLVMAICRMAARGDAMPAPVAQRRPAPAVAPYAAHTRRARPGARLAAHGARLHNVG